LAPENDGAHQQRLARHLRDLLSRTPVAARGAPMRPPAAAPAGGLERLPTAPVHDREELERQAHELERGRAPHLVTANAEAIILPDLRPVLDVVEGRFGEPGAHFPELSASPRKVEAAIPAVGRIDVAGLPGVPYLGTGFVVGEKLLLTNRHVAEAFVSGLGARPRLRFLPGVEASVDLKHEIDRPEALLLRVRKPLLVHPYWDMALLEVEGLDGIAPLRLLASAPGEEVQPVAIVGYPAFDPRNAADVQQKVFRGRFGVKRLQPGYTKGTARTVSFGREVAALGHDCSTLGGNSGSCLLDVRTGHVLGLHFGGAYLESNYAVPAWQLARDPRVVDAGVLLHGKPDRRRPDWVSAWTGLEGKGSGRGRGRGKAAPSAPGRERPVEWYERTGPDDLRAEWQADPEGCAARLARAAGPVDARAARARLAEGRSESLFTRRVDPDAAEILFLHGIMGAHLDTPDGRTWLDLERILFGDLAGRLALSADGVSDAWSPPATPGPHLKLTYQRAAAAWRDEGLVVHPFSYDWRKPVEIEAERLHGFVEALALGRPGRRLLLVAHSMGGLVAAAYAARHREWKERIQRAVLLGAPLRGSFAPFEAIQGTYPVFRKLALASPRNTLADLQAMARTLSGLVDMLPDPAVFPDAEALYRAEAWDAGFAPAGALLQRSRKLKATLAESPLLEGAVALVSAGHATVSSVAEARDRVRRTRPGDGTVPVDSAAPPGTEAYLVHHEHSGLPRDPRAIAAVLRLARGQPVGLERLSEVRRRAPVPLAEALVGELEAYDQERVRLVRERLATSALDGSDVDWLLSTGFDVPDREAEEAAVLSPAAGAVPGTEGPAFREFQLGGPWGMGDPVHETITRVAMDAADLPAAGRDQILRGLFWNDDPEALLFTRDDDEPLRKSTGLLFALKFKRYQLCVAGKRPIAPADGLLARSHFGDLQYLHAMASTDVEPPEKTRQAMLGWAEVCWKLATGGLSPAAGPDQLGPMLPGAEGFPPTAARLLACSPAEVPLRALGSLFHLVEDSYAGGHVEREVLGPTRRGRIRRFFCYTSQDHAAHAALDRWHGGKTVPEKLAGLPGAEDAAEQAGALARLFARGAAWAEVKSWLRQGPWVLAGGAPQERVREKRARQGRGKGKRAARIAAR